MTLGKPISKSSNYYNRILAIETVRNQMGGQFLMKDIHFEYLDEQRKSREVGVFDLMVVYKDMTL